MQAKEHAAWGNESRSPVPGVALLHSFCPSGLRGCSARLLLCSARLRGCSVRLLGLAARLGRSSQLLVCGLLVSGMLVFRHVLAGCIGWLFICGAERERVGEGEG